jgi:hypothetical protein
LQTPLIGREGPQPAICDAAKGHAEAALHITPSYGQSKYANRSRMMVHQKSLYKKGRLQANGSHFDPLRRSSKMPPSPLQPKS